MMDQACLLSLIIEYADSDLVDQTKMLLSVSVKGRIKITVDQSINGNLYMNRKWTRYKVRFHPSSNSGVAD